MPTLENREGALLVTQVSECLGHLIFRQTLLVKIKLQNMTLQVISCLVFILSFFKLWKLLKYQEFGYGWVGKSGMFLILYSVFLVIVEEQQSHELSQCFDSRSLPWLKCFSHGEKTPPPTESLPCRASVDRKHNLSQECDLAAKSSKCDLKWHQYKTSGQDKEGYSPRVHSAGVGSHLENGVCFCVLKLIWQIEVYPSWVTG